jgi:hypothetical protein
MRLSLLDRRERREEVALALADRLLDRCRPLVERAVDRLVERILRPLMPQRLTFGDPLGVGELRPRGPGRKFSAKVPICPAAVCSAERSSLRVMGARTAVRTARQHVLWHCWLHPNLRRLRQQPNPHRQPHLRGIPDLAIRGTEGSVSAPGLGQPFSRVRRTRQRCRCGPRLGSHRHHARRICLTLAPVGGRARADDLPLP